MALALGIIAIFTAATAGYILGWDRGFCRARNDAERLIELQGKTRLGK